MKRGRDHAARDHVGLTSCTHCGHGIAEPCTCTTYCGSILCDRYSTHWLKLAREDGLGEFG